MKKLLLLLLALAVILALVACGETNETETQNAFLPDVEENKGFVEDSTPKDPFAGYTFEYLESPEGRVLQLLYHTYRAESDWSEANNDFEVKSVTNQRIKIYTPEEIAENRELFDGHELCSGDIPFEATVDLEIYDSVEDLNKFTAGTGEIDGHTIKDKYQCGILRAVEDGYELDLVGTSF